MKEDHQINIPPIIDEKTKRLEGILGIKPGEDYTISDISLKNLTIDDFPILLPYLNNIRTLRLSNSVISNVSELMKLNRCIYFQLDNVTFQNNDCTIIKDFPYEIRFSNMNFDANCMNGLQTSGPRKGHKHLFIKNCHIDNIQELSNIEGLYSLHLDKITFTYHPKKIKEKSIWMIHISDSQFEDISFIPFKKSVTYIEFKNCQIGSFDGISEFKKLEKIKIDTDSSVERLQEIKNRINKQIKCHFVQTEKPFGLKKILGLKNYINHLHFTNLKEKTIDNLGKFKKVKVLSFDKSKFYVDAFLHIAKQIESVEMRDSAIKKHNYLENFLNLTNFESICFSRDGKSIRNFSKLLPLKNQLKELDFYEDDEMHKKPANYSIEQFTALESLKIGYEISSQTAESILKLEKLKKLNIDVTKTKKVFDLGNLKRLEFLIFNSRVQFTGFENLKRLKSLQIVNDRKFDVKTLPEMKSLKRLNFSAYDSSIKDLERFPNLEFLKLQGVKKLQLKALKKLKVLDLENSRIKDFSSFETLPSVEKLNLSNIQGNINLEGISKFPNLKWLTFLESEELDDISGLESLKKLERLDLYKTKVTDIRVLNTLPNLKEVNLLVDNAKELNLESQLNHREIVIYCGLPSVNLWIWERDEFGI